MSQFVAKVTNQQYPLVLAQYKRDDFGIGTEQHLHWALLVVTDSKHISGPCFQAVDRTYQDARGKKWSAHFAPAASLMAMDKCLGAVQIGTVKHRELDAFIACMQAHATVPKFNGWNCRDYVLELVEILRSLGHIRSDIARGRPCVMQDFLPELRQVSYICENGTTRDLIAKHYKDHKDHLSGSFVAPVTQHYIIPMVNAVVHNLSENFTKRAEFRNPRQSGEVC
ncbi:hypothetical protein EWM64_g9979 [Hericium alpestre]|uniref:Uncharacterized protein n=1 Tax=Hericium alpestre TaxID=135208 RepID=A0A4Y9ZJG7_9AGAM|nr:hypothetical protein EWM64_g9979 [Hericium alpestre]